MMISRKISHQCIHHYQHYGTRLIHLPTTIPLSSSNQQNRNFAKFHKNKNHNAGKKKKQTDVSSISEHEQLLETLFPTQTHESHKNQLLSRYNTGDNDSTGDNNIGGNGDGGGVEKNATRKTKLNISREEEDKMLKFLRFAHEGKSQELKKHGYQYDRSSKGYYKTFVSEGMKKMDEEDDFFNNPDPLLDGYGDGDDGDDMTMMGDGNTPSIIDDAFQLEEISREPPLPPLEDVLSQAELILKNMFSKSSINEFERLSSEGGGAAQRFKRDAMPNRSFDDGDDMSEARENLNRFDSPYFDEANDALSSSSSSSSSLFHSTKHQRDDGTLVGENREGEQVDENVMPESGIEDNDEDEDADEDCYDPNVRFVQFKISDEAIDALKDFEYETRASIDVDPLRTRSTVRDRNELIDMCLYAFDDGAKQEEMLEKKFELSDMQRRMTLENLPTLDVFARLRKNKLYTEVSGLPFIDEVGTDDVVQRAGDVKYTFGYDESKGRISRLAKVETETRIVPSLYEKGDAAEMANEQFKKLYREMVDKYVEQFNSMEQTIHTERSHRFQSIVSSIGEHDVPRLVQFMHTLAEQLGFKGSLQDMRRSQPSNWSDFCHKLQEMVIDEDDDSDLVRGMILFDIDPDGFIRDYMTESASFQQMEELKTEFAEQLAKGASVDQFQSYADDSAFHRDETYDTMVNDLETDFGALLKSISEASAFIPVSERKQLGLGTDLSPEGILRGIIKTGIKAQRDSASDGVLMSDHHVTTQTETDDLVHLLDRMSDLTNGNMSEEEAQEMMRQLAQKLPKK